MKEAKEFLKTQKNWKEDSKGMYDFNSLANLLTEFAKELQHHRDTTIGLWATDRPDLVSDPKAIMFQLKDQKK
jgi:hypothetical protein